MDYLLHSATFGVEGVDALVISLAAAALACSLVSNVLTLKTRQEFVSLLKGSLQRVLEKRESDLKHRYLQAYCKFLKAVIMQFYQKAEDATRCLPGTPIDPVIGMIIQSGILNLLASVPACFDLSHRMFSKTMNEVLVPFSRLATIASAYCIPYDDLTKASEARLHGVDSVLPQVPSDKAPARPIACASPGAASAYDPATRLEELIRGLLNSGAGPGDEVLEPLLLDAHQLHRRQHGRRGRRLHHHHDLHDAHPWMEVVRSFVCISLKILPMAFS